MDQPGFVVRNTKQCSAIRPSGGCAAQPLRPPLALARMSANGTRIKWLATLRCRQPSIRLATWHITVNHHTVTTRCHPRIYIAPFVGQNSEAEQEGRALRGAAPSARFCG